MAGNDYKKLFTYQTLAHAVAGATGSVVAMGTFFPLDTVRSRLQLDENREAKNTFLVLGDLVAEEGFPTLYRGIVPVLESLCASNFVYFYAFHGLKAMRGGTAADQSAVKDLVLASVAGVVNVLTTTPLWVVNTRLKMKGIQSAAHASATAAAAASPAHAQPPVPYDGLIEGLLYIARLQGVSKLWSGTVPSLFLVANPAIQFMTYEAIKRRLLLRYDAKDLGAGAYFLVGAAAKAVATVLTYPLQLVQTKLRHGHNFRDLPPDAGMVQLTYYIIKKYGIAGLFKGMESKILQTIMTAALMFAAYEKIAGFVLRLLLNQQKVSKLN